MNNEAISLRREYARSDSAKSSENRLRDRIGKSPAANLFLKMLVLVFILFLLFWARRVVNRVANSIAQFVRLSIVAIIVGVRDGDVYATLSYDNGEGSREREKGDEKPPGSRRAKLARIATSITSTTEAIRAAMPRRNVEPYLRTKFTHAAYARPARAKLVRLCETQTRV